MRIIHTLLSVPFIITPFLFTNKFIDPSLYIKKISIYIIFSILALLFIVLKKSKNKFNQHAQTILKLLIIYIVYQVIVSFYISINVSESLWEIFYFTGWIFIYTFFISYINDQQFKNIIISTAIIGSLLSLLVYNDLFNIISINIPSSGKLSATFGYKNFFAQYLCFVIPACICSIYLIKQKREKNLMVLLTFISIGALIITRCRAAWLGIFFMMIVYIFLNRKTIRNDIKKLIHTKGSLPIIIASTILLSFIIFKPIDISTGIWIGDKSSFKETLLSIQDINKKSTWGDRVEMYQGSFKMIKDHLFLGVGLGNWKVLYPGYSNNNFYTDYTKHKVILRPHNDLLWITTETGLLGLILLIVFIGYHVKLLFLKFKSRDDDNHYLMLFCILSLVAIFIESLFDFPKERVIPNLYVWLILGYIVSSNIKCNKQINFISIILIIALPIITFFTFLDLKSHFYSQQIVGLKNNKQYKKMEMSSVISMYYMRDLDHIATPIPYYLGLAHYNMGNKDLASKFFNKALTISPYHIGSLQNKMLMYIERGQFDNAYKTMTQIESIYPRLHKPRIKMIQYCIKANKIDLAKTILSEINDNINEPIKRELDQLKKTLYQ